MITNKRQYLITRKRADSFRQALQDFERSSSNRKAVHPRLLQAEREGMESLLHTLTLELSEYEQLQSQQTSVIAANSFEKLAEGLIKARIAAHLSQAELAKRLNLKEQQIQRYETERYESTSYRRLCEVARALGVRIEHEILLPKIPMDLRDILKKASQAGLKKSFIFARLLSTADLARLNGEVPGDEQGQDLVSRLLDVFERVFGWSPDNVLGSSALSTPDLDAGSRRFRNPYQRINPNTKYFTTYALYLARAVAHGLVNLGSKTRPLDLGEVKSRIRQDGKESLQSMLGIAWDLGVSVLPLRGRAAFHGACVRCLNQNVVILKQTSNSEARWMFDLLHELYHAAQNPTLSDFEFIEEESSIDGGSDTKEELEANRFASDVLLHGRSEELSERCLHLAGKDVLKLRSAVAAVAEESKVSADVLANHVAFNLSKGGINRLGVATNLQGPKSDPYGVARSVFLERFPFRMRDEIDGVLLDRALNYDLQ